MNYLEFGERFAFCTKANLPKPNIGGRTKRTHKRKRMTSNEMESENLMTFCVCWMSETIQRSFVRVSSWGQFTTWEWSNLWYFVLLCLLWKLNRWLIKFLFRSIRFQSQISGFSLTLFVCYHNDYSDKRSSCNDMFSPSYFTVCLQTNLITSKFQRPSIPSAWYSIK